MAQSNELQEMKAMMKNCMAMHAKMQRSLENIESSISKDEISQAKKPRHGADNYKNLKEVYEKALKAESQLQRGTRSQNHHYQSSSRWRNSSHTWPKKEAPKEVSEVVNSGASKISNPKFSSAEKSKSSTKRSRTEKPRHAHELACFKCQGRGHYQSQCPNHKTMIFRDGEIGKYKDEVLCDVVPMQTSHMILGRHWIYDKETVHHGKSNKYSFVHNNEKHVLVPLTPSEVHRNLLTSKQRLAEFEQSNLSLFVQRAKLNDCLYSSRVCLELNFCDFYSFCSNFLSNPTKVEMFSKLQICYEVQEQGNRALYNPQKNQNWTSEIAFKSPCLGLKISGNLKLCMIEFSFQSLNEILLIDLNVFKNPMLDLRKLLADFLEKF